MDEDVFCKEFFKLVENNVAERTSSAACEDFHCFGAVFL